MIQRPPHAEIRDARCVNEPPYEKKTALRIAFYVPRASFLKPDLRMGGDGTFFCNLCAPLGSSPEALDHATGSSGLFDHRLLGAR